MSTFDDMMDAWFANDCKGSIDDYEDCWADHLIAEQERSENKNEKK